MGHWEPVDIGGRPVDGRTVQPVRTADGCRVQSGGRKWCSRCVVPQLQTAVSLCSVRSEEELAVGLGSNEIRLLASSFPAVT